MRMLADAASAVQEISRVINYCRDMEQLTTLPTAPPGIPKVTIYGGKLETKRRELADLFRSGQAHWWGFGPHKTPG